MSTTAAATNVASMPAAVKKSPFEVMASRLNLQSDEVQSLMMNTLMKAKADRNGNPQQVTNEELVTFLAIANEYQLNPLSKEIYAFNNRGAIQPIVSIDGWLKIINNHPQFDGMEFIDNFTDEGLISVTCQIFRKDRSRPTEVTEYMAECAGKSEPWTKWPARMLRHKATIQAARYAFGLSGIIDEDEADRYRQTTLPQERDVTPTSSSLQSKIQQNVSQHQEAPASSAMPDFGDDQPAGLTPVSTLLDMLSVCEPHDMVEWKAAAMKHPEGSADYDRLVNAYNAKVKEFKEKKNVSS